MTVPLNIPDEFVAQLAKAVADRAGDLLLERLEAAASPWMTVEEAAEYTRTTLGTFRAQSAAGTWPSHGEGRRRVYHRDELDRVLLGTAQPSSSRGGLRAA